MPDPPKANTPRPGEEATCFCGRNIRSDGQRWTHADDGSTFCYPGDPRDGETRAEPEDG